MIVRRPRELARVCTRWILRAATIAGVSTCGGEGTGPTSTVDPGFVRVSVAGPVSPEVAFKLRITGGAVDSVRSAGGTLYVASPEVGLHRAIVVGATDRTRLLEFWLPNRDSLVSYRAELEEVADVTTYENLAVAGYTITLGR